MYHFAIVIVFVFAGYQTDARSPIREKPICACPLIYRPVCGTNGVTFGNSCELRCAQASNIVVEMDCEGPCPCTSDGNGGQNVCLQPKVTGPCKAAIQVWFYDLTTNRCGQFVYGGCQGNGNRFGSKKECETTCTDPKTQDPCVLPKVIGRCRASIPRWYYDINEADCKAFAYGGCDANANNFDTRQKCLDRC